MKGKILIYKAVEIFMGHIFEYVSYDGEVWFLDAIREIKKGNE